MAGIYKQAVEKNRWGFFLPPSPQSTTVVFKPGKE
jgi:hypothetical protein